MVLSHMSRAWNGLSYTYTLDMLARSSELIPLPFPPILYDFDLLSCLYPLFYIPFCSCFTRWGWTSNNCHLIWLINYPKIKKKNNWFYIDWMKCHIRYRSVQIWLVGVSVNWFFGSRKFLTITELKISANLFSVNRKLSFVQTPNRNRTEKID